MSEMYLPSTYEELETLLHNPLKQEVLKQVYTPQNLEDFEHILQQDRQEVQQLLVRAREIAGSSPERTLDVLLALARPMTTPSTDAYLQRLSKPIEKKDTGEKHAW